MNKCFKLLRKYKNTMDKTVWKEYKCEKSRIRIMLRNEELKYWKDQFAQAKNSNEFWKIVREIQGKSSISTLKDGDGNIVTDDLGKAKCLNKFFSSIGKKLADELEEPTTELETKVELIHPLQRVEAKWKGDFRFGGKSTRSFKKLLLQLQKAFCFFCFGYFPGYFRQFF